MMKSNNKSKFKTNPLRLGIISTAGINVLSIFNVIGNVKGMVLQAVASRDLPAADKYANKYGIPQAYGNYEELLELPYIDCVYIPLPNSMHAEWAIKALRAGKHVLCEKPMATSIEESEALIKAQQETDKILMEAMHYRYHPIAKKVEEIVRGGDLGEVIEVSSSFCQWLPVSGHIRYSKDLKGGVLLDMGCYTVDAVRWIANLNPPPSPFNKGGIQRGLKKVGRVSISENKWEVGNRKWEVNRNKWEMGNGKWEVDKNVKIITASMKMLHTGVDHTTQAKLLFVNGIKASIFVTYKHYLPIELRVKGTHGSLYLFSPFAPVAPIGKHLRVPVYQLWVMKSLRINSRNLGVSLLSQALQPYIIYPLDATYYYQLCAFRDAIISGKQPITSPLNCLENTKILEAICEKAGGNLTTKSRRIQRGEASTKIFF